MERGGLSNQVRSKIKMYINNMENDVDLSPEQLDDKYNPEGGGQHPVHTRSEWIQDVANENTLSGYWEWVSHQLILKQEEDAEAGMASRLNFQFSRL